MVLRAKTQDRMQESDLQQRVLRRRLLLLGKRSRVRRAHQRFKNLRLKT